MLCSWLVLPSCKQSLLKPQKTAQSSLCAPAVAFKIYDLDKTGWIEPGEIKRLMAALLHDNPAIALTDADIDSIVDQVLKLAAPKHVSRSSCRTGQCCWGLFSTPHLIADRSSWGRRRS